MAAGSSSSSSSSSSSASDSDPGYGYASAKSSTDADPGNVARAKRRVKRKWTATANVLGELLDDLHSRKTARSSSPQYEPGQQQAFQTLERYWHQGPWKHRWEQQQAQPLQPQHQQPGTVQGQARLMLLPPPPPPFPSGFMGKRPEHLVRPQLDGPPPPPTASTHEAAAWRQGEPVAEVPHALWPGWPSAPPTGWVPTALPPFPPPWRMWRLAPAGVTAAMLGVRPATMQQPPGTVASTPPAASPKAPLPGEAAKPALGPFAAAVDAAEAAGAKQAFRSPSPLTDCEEVKGRTKPEEADGDSGDDEETETSGEEKSEPGLVRQAAKVQQEDTGLHN